MTQELRRAERIVLLHCLARLAHQDLDTARYIGHALGLLLGTLAMQRKRVSIEPAQVLSVHVANRPLHRAVIVAKVVEAGETLRKPGELYELVGRHEFAQAFKGAIQHPLHRVAIVG